MDIVDKLLEVKEVLIAIGAGVGGYLLKFLDVRAKAKNEVADAEVKFANASRIKSEVKDVEQNRIHKDMAFIIDSLKKQLADEIGERQALAKQVKDLDRRLLLFADENFNLKKNIEKLETENNALRSQLDDLQSKYDALKKTMDGG